MTRAEEIARNLEAVRARIAAAERAAGRGRGGVKLIAVSKKMPASDVEAALAAGQADFGENYGQELRDKRDALAAIAALKWHFIGPLQTNKVKYAAGKVALLHTLDGAELLDEANRRAAAAGATAEAPQECLVQVNVAGEAQKRGVAPEALPALLDHFATTPLLRCVGLMTIPPLVDDPEASRPSFVALRWLLETEAVKERPHVELSELSMGMSHDLEVAVSEGATWVRVGTAIFGRRT